MTQAAAGSRAAQPAPTFEMVEVKLTQEQQTLLTKDRQVVIEAGARDAHDDQTERLNRGCLHRLYKFVKDEPTWAGAAAGAVVGGGGAVATVGWAFAEYAPQKVAEAVGFSSEAGILGAMAGGALGGFAGWAVDKCGKTIGALFSQPAAT
jgi:hypothetical protein